MASTRANVLPETLSSFELQLSPRAKVIDEEDEAVPVCFCFVLFLFFAFVFCFCFLFLFSFVCCF